MGSPSLASNTQEQAPVLSPDEAAAALIASLSTDTETTDETASETQETPEKKPEQPKEEDPKKLLADERKRASELFAKAQSQHAALARRTKALEAKEREIATQVDEISKLSSISELVSYVAKRTGVNETTVWQDVVDQIQNGGKRSPEAELKSEVQRLKADREAEKASLKAKADSEEEQAQAAKEAEIASKWQESTASLASSDATRWPSLSTHPAIMVGAAALQIVNQVFDRTGVVPTQEQVLDYLEQQAAPAVAPADPKTAKPKVGVAKAKTVTNQESASPPNPRDLTPAEREALATKQLEALLRA